MASPNVDKMMLAVRDNPEFALEVSASLVKIERAAGVNLTVAEKQEFFRELAQHLTQERVTLTWD